MAFTLDKRMPTVKEYTYLRQLAGWPIFEEKQIMQALSNSLVGVCALNNDAIIGMGRIVGDGVIYFHIQDVIIHPQFQRQGVGKLIMNELMDFVTANGVKHTNAGLMCSKGREEFYKGFGFIERPSDKFGAGMIKILE